MDDILFLFVLAIVWIFFASIQDLRQRMVANWIVFSLAIFSLGFRFFYSLFGSDNFAFFYQGIVGLAIFFLIGNLFYYSRLFAAGDAKLMISLGAVLPYSDIFYANFVGFGYFLLIFLIIGGFYGLIWSFFLSFSRKNFRKYKSQMEKYLSRYKFPVTLALLLGILLIISGYPNFLLVYLGTIVILLPLLSIHAKAVDETSLVVSVKPRELEEGDWLYKEIKIGRKAIRPSWHGLTQREIVLIKKKFNKVEIRQGIPFVPVFLVSFLIWIYFVYSEISLSPLF